MALVPNTKTLVVAGNFARAGGLSCVGICAWDIAGSRFNTLGNGLGTGVVQDLAFAGVSSLLLIFLFPLLMTTLFSHLQASLLSSAPFR